MDGDVLLRTIKNYKYTKQDMITMKFSLGCVFYEALSKDL